LVVAPWDGIFADVRSQWTAEPGIDLVKGASVPVRAYLESRFLVSFSAKLERAYPGFTDAVLRNEPSDSPDIAARNRFPEDELNPGSGLAPLTGNLGFHFLSESTTSDDVSVTVCRYIYAIAKDDKGQFVSNVGAGPGPETRGVNAMRVRLARPSKPSGDLAPQTGSAPAPTDDVFGGWRITGFLAQGQLDYPGPEWPNENADRTACINKAPDPADRRVFLVAGSHPRADFPTSPPSPGWPEE
jgi:hypothetical protein